MKHKSSRGFTIVELLVVIVVIGILAAITIVSYSGISNKARTSANQANANSVLQAALAVYAESPTNAYPLTNATSQTVINNLNSQSAKVSGGITVNNAQLAAGSTILYLNKSNTGVCVGYWDYSGAGSVAWLYGGDATTGTNSGTPTCA